MPNAVERIDDSDGLRRFGLALVRDERLVTDDQAAARLVDKLLRQCGVAPVVDGPRRCGRVAVYARFVELYRRHVRRMALDDETHWSESVARSAGVVCGVRALPLELRETLLLVGLARFSHAEAAQALDVPLPRLVERLERGRSRLAVHMGVDLGVADLSGAPHLRVIK